MSRSVSRRSVLATTAAAASAAAVGSLATATTAHAAPPTLPNGTSKDKVLVVGIDGLRHDVIAAAGARTSRR